MYKPIFTQLSRRVSVPVAGALAGTVQHQKGQNHSGVLLNNQENLSGLEIQDYEDIKLVQALNKHEPEDFQIVSGDDIIKAADTITQYVEGGQIKKDNAPVMSNSHLDESSNLHMVDLNESNRKESIRYLLKAGADMAQNKNVRNSIIAELQSDPKLRQSLMGVSQMLTQSEAPQIEYPYTSLRFEPVLANDLPGTSSIEDSESEAQLDPNTQEKLIQSIKEHLFGIGFNIVKGYNKGARAIGQAFKKMNIFFLRIGQNIRHKASSLNEEDLDAKDELELRSFDTSIGIVTTIATVVILVAILKSPVALAQIYNVKL